MNDKTLKFKHRYLKFANNIWDTHQRRTFGHNHSLLVLETNTSPCQLWIQRNNSPTKHLFTRITPLVAEHSCVQFPLGSWDTSSVYNIFIVINVNIDIYICIYTRLQVLQISVNMEIEQNHFSHCSLYCILKKGVRPWFRFNFWKRKWKWHGDKLKTHSISKIKIVVWITKFCNPEASILLHAESVMHAN